MQQRARRLPADKRRRQIIESARDIFASQSYARVGTADLAKAAGISEPGLYRHFSGKKELFLATIRSTGPRLLKIWEEIACDYEDPIESLWAIGVYYYDHLESHATNMKLQFRAISEADDPEIRDAPMIYGWSTASPTGNGYFYENIHSESSTRGWNVETFHVRAL